MDLLLGERESKLLVSDAVRSLACGVAAEAEFVKLECLRELSSV